jgi:O-acetyl-ADP-ribose deacetylase (regulator of RNase III)
MQNEYLENKMLKREQGDLLDMAEHGDFDIIVHGCNCFNTMGSGIARQIADRYPQAKEADNATPPGTIQKLGRFTHASTDRFMIVNAYTQFETSKSGEDVFEYASFEVILRKLAHDFPESRFGLPYIGMGLANGDEDRIMKLLEDFAEKVSSTGGSVTLVKWVNPNA